MAVPTVERLHFTGDPAADTLLAQDPLALLIGFVLDQQVPMPKAFSGPLVLKERLGHLDAQHIAGMPLGELDEVFRQKPAIHRFPGSMAGRAERIWTDAADADDLRRRLSALPGFGPMKVRICAAVLAKRLGVEVARPLVPDHPTPGDIDSDEARERYQEAKRAYKARQRAAQP